jgi:ankyrin repeat protein
MERQLNSRLILQMLLSRSDIDVNATAQLESGMVATPLLLAIYNQQLDVITSLLQHPAIQVNALFEHDISQQIPLLAAVESGDIDIVRALLEQGPELDVNVQNNEGAGALLFSMILNFDDIFDLLLSDQRVDVNAGAMDNNPLLWTIANSRRRMFEALLERGADVCNHPGIYELARDAQTNDDGAAIFEIVRSRIGSCVESSTEILSEISNVFENFQAPGPWRP